MFKKAVQTIVDFIVIKVIGPIRWKQTSPLEPQDIEHLREMLTKDYYIIATRRSNFLTTFIINLGHFVYTGRWGFYTHVLMNLEDDIKCDEDFRLIEAASFGTQYITFDKMVRHCDAVALLKIRGLTIEEWTSIMDAARLQLGKEYDTLFDIHNDQRLSCVELVRLALRLAIPDYYVRFTGFEDLIRRTRNLTPQMFLESKEFEVVWEVRR